MKMLYVLIIFTALMILSMSDFDKMPVVKKENTNETTESDRSEPPNGTHHNIGSLRAATIR